MVNILIIIPMKSIATNKITVMTVGILLLILLTKLPLITKKHVYEVLYLKMKSIISL